MLFQFKAQISRLFQGFAVFDVAICTYACTLLVDCFLCLMQMMIHDYYIKVRLTAIAKRRHPDTKLITEGYANPFESLLHY